MQGKVYMKYDLFLWIFVAHVKVVELYKYMFMYLYPCCLQPREKF